MTTSPGFSAAVQTADVVARRVHTVSTLPHMALRVMEIAQNPRSHAQDLRQVMETDPAFSARVLKCVNSSAYGLRSRIKNLQHAIAYLGVEQIRNMAMTAAVSELFQKEQVVGHYSRMGLWRHLLAVGICARMIASRSGMANFEEMFLAGLLHDLGIVLEDEYLHRNFVTVIDSLRADASLADAERPILGFDHMALGERVMHEWRFPESIVAAARHHHQAFGCPKESLQVVQCVEVANLICSLKGITSVGTNLVAFSSDAILALSFTGSDLAVLADDLDAELAANEHMFEI